MGRKSRAKLGRRGPASAYSPRRSGWRASWKWIAGGVVGLLIVAGAVGAWQPWNAGRTTLAPAPRFNLMSASGPVITLDDFLGKQEVVLIFYMGAG